MRKSWKWALCLGVVSLLLLGGCGKEKTEPVDLVLVTDGSEVASDAVYQSAWNGLAQYGDESGLKYEASVPAGRTTEDYENTIKEAAQKGASVIVCAGTSMSRAVYDAQRDWKDVRFLLLEAEPVSESGRSRLRGNTESLEIDASEAMRQYRPATRTWAISDRKTKRTEQSTGQVMHSVQRRPLRIWDLEKTASRWIIRIGKAAAYHRRIWKKSKAGTVRADRFSSRTVHRIRMYLAQQHLRQAEH